MSLEKIKHLPDPMLGEKDHYLPFRGAFKKKITERDRPSLAHKILTRSQNPYHSQHVYNTSTISESCCKVKNATLWRLLYSKRKLYIQDKTEIQYILDGLAYTCGSALQNLHLPEKFSCVYKKIRCSDPI